MVSFFQPPIFCTPSTQTDYFYYSTCYSIDLRWLRVVLQILAKPDCLFTSIHYPIWPHQAWVLGSKGWLSLKAGHLITRLCACILRSTKEDNVMARIKIDKSLSDHVKAKSTDVNKSQITIQRLNAKESKEHSERMGLPTSNLIIGNTIKGGRK
jgi:hypothetical protein